MRLIPTILCGGAGSRLWPVSRELHPKPFIRLSDGQSLLQKTCLRAASLANIEDLLLVTNRELFFKMQDECREVNLDKLNLSYILEPFARNTAAAIAAAALHIAQNAGENVIMLVMPADHIIVDKLAFSTSVDKACELAKTGQLVTFGIKPDRPETGYGYIEAEGSRVLQFIEKPSLDKAENYYASGNFLWNAGIFCFTVKTILEEMQQHCPEILSTTKNCLSQSNEAIGTGFKQIELNAPSFEAVPDISIDYAVIEKSMNVSVVPCNMGWSDIGSWCALSELQEPDENGNRIEGRTALLNVTNSYIKGQDRLIGAIGVTDLFIIDTPDALLVADKKCAQEVKHIYSQLKNQGNGAYKQHRTVYRPWGTYTVLEEGKNFKIKRIEVRAGASLSLQMHHHRSEHWIVVSGMAKIINGELEMFLRINESTYIPAGHKHRLENPGVLPLVMIEVQSGEYMGEDDIMRFDDVYGRI